MYAPPGVDSDSSGESDTPPRPVRPPPPKFSLKSFLIPPRSKTRSRPSFPSQADPPSSPTSPASPPASASPPQSATKRVGEKLKKRVRIFAHDETPPNEQVDLLSPTLSKDPKSPSSPAQNQPGAAFQTPVETRSERSGRVEGRKEQSPLAGEVMDLLRQLLLESSSSKPTPSRAQQEPPQSPPPLSDQPSPRRRAAPPAPAPSNSPPAPDSLSDSITSSPNLSYKEHHLNQTYYDKFAHLPVESREPNIHTLPSRKSSLPTLDPQEGTKSPQLPPSQPPARPPPDPPQHPSWGHYMPHQNQYPSTNQYNTTQWPHTQPLSAPPYGYHFPSPYSYAPYPPAPPYPHPPSLQPWNPYYPAHPSHPNPQFQPPPLSHPPQHPAYFPAQPPHPPQHHYSHSSVPPSTPAPQLSSPWSPLPTPWPDDGYLHADGLVLKPASEARGMQPQRPQDARSIQVQLDRTDSTATATNAEVNPGPEVRPRRPSGPRAPRPQNSVPKVVVDPGTPSEGGVAKETSNNGPRDAVDENQARTQRNSSQPKEVEIRGGSEDDQTSETEAIPFPAPPPSKPIREKQLVNTDPLQPPSSSPPQSNGSNSSQPKTKSIKEDIAPDSISKHHPTSQIPVEIKKSIKQKAMMKAHNEARQAAEAGAPPIDENKILERAKGYEKAMLASWLKQNGASGKETGEKSARDPEGAEEQLETKGKEPEPLLIKTPKSVPAQSSASEHPMLTPPLPMDQGERPALSPEDAARIKEKAKRKAMEEARKEAKKSGKPPDGNEMKARAQAYEKAMIKSFFESKRSEGQKQMREDEGASVTREVKGNGTGTSQSKDRDHTSSREPRSPPERGNQSEPVKSTPSPPKPSAGVSGPPSLTDEELAEIRKQAKQGAMAEAQKKAKETGEKIDKLAYSARLKAIEKKMVQALSEKKGGTLEGAQATLGTPRTRDKQEEEKGNRDERKVNDGGREVDGDVSSRGIREIQHHDVSTDQDSTCDKSQEGRRARDMIVSSTERQSASDRMPGQWDETSSPQSPIPSNKKAASLGSALTLPKSEHHAVTWTTCLVSLATCIHLANELKDRFAGEDTASLVHKAMPGLVQSLLAQKDLLSTMRGVLGEEHAPLMNEFVDHLQVIQEFLASQSRSQSVTASRDDAEQLKDLGQASSQAFESGSLAAVIEHLVGLSDYLTPSLVQSLKDLLLAFRQDGLTAKTLVHAVTVVKREILDANPRNEGEQVSKVPGILDKLLGILHGESKESQPTLPPTRPTRSSQPRTPPKSRVPDARPNVEVPDSRRGSHESQLSQNSLQSHRSHRSDVQKARHRLSPEKVKDMNDDDENINISSSESSTSSSSSRSSSRRGSVSSRYSSSSASTTRSLSKRNSHVPAEDEIPLPPATADFLRSRSTSSPHRRAKSPAKNPAHIIHGDAVVTTPPGPAQGSYDLRGPSPPPNTSTDDDEAGSESVEVSGDVSSSETEVSDDEAARLLAHADSGPREVKTQIRRESQEEEKPSRDQVERAKKLMGAPLVTRTPRRRVDSESGD